MCIMKTNCCPFNIKSDDAPLFEWEALEARGSESHPREDESDGKGRCAGDTAGSQKHQNVFLCWVIFGHHTPDALVFGGGQSIIFNPLLGEVADRVSRTGYRLHRGINNNGTASGFCEGVRCEQPEDIEVFHNPDRVFIAVSRCPVWYFCVFGCHGREASSGS